MSGDYQHTIPQLFYIFLMSGRKSMMSLRNCLGHTKLDRRYEPAVYRKQRGVQRIYAPFHIVPTLSASFHDLGIQGCLDLRVVTSKVHVNKHEGSGTKRECEV